MKKSGFWRRPILIIILVVAVAGLWYWRSRASRPSYEEYTVDTGDIRESFELSGKLAADKSASLRFGAGGLVTYVGAEEGDKIKKWQTIASVDTRLLQNVLQQKLNTYMIQRNTFDQTVDDNDDKSPAGDAERTLRRLLAKNQYQLDNTVKDVEYQDLQIRLSRIYSPIDGILIHSPVTVANVQVTPTDFWQIVDPSTLVFQADLDELDLEKVHTGQSVEVVFDAYPDLKIQSSVSSISFAPKETTTGTTYQVKIAIPAGQVNALRLGLNGTATLMLSEKTGVPTLPLSAVAVSGGLTKVTVMENGKYITREIKTGIEDGDKVEIVSGLTAGEHVYKQK